MIKTIRWPIHERLHFLGRNGQGKCTGLEVYVFDGVVQLEPFTSRNEIGRAHIRLPVAAVSELVEVLTEIDRAVTLEPVTAGK